jgi:hypothetical protein
MRHRGRMQLLTREKRGIAYFGAALGHLKRIRSYYYEE